jgi:DNA-binding NarL/FixJ family response regulator
MVRILIVDDHAVVRRGVRALLQPSSEWEICGEAENGEDAVRQAENLKPEIIIMDLSMPVMNGLQATRVIRESNPEVKVVLFSLHTSSELVRSIFMAGAQGYVLKSDAETDLITALEAVHHNKTYVSPAIDPNLVMRVLSQVEAERKSAS